MSQNVGSNRPGPSRPLIQRPRTSHPPQMAAPTTSSSNLGNAIAGALTGMGMTPGGVWNPAMMYSAAHGSSYPQGPVPSRDFQAGANTALQWSGVPQQSPTGGVYNPAFMFQHQQQSAYHYPQVLHPPNYPVPQPFYPQHPSHAPLTTPDGYTLSSSYVPPPHQAGTLSNESGRPSKKPRRGGKFPAAAVNAQPPPDPSLDPSPKAVKPPPASRGPEKFSCCQTDCKFTGSKKQVREHEEDRHLIYAPGREPKPWQGSYKSGATIEGTGISLDSPEAVAKWIEDRKKRWPTNKVVAEKEAQRSERIAAGLERAPWPRGRGRGRGRGERGRGSLRGGRGGSHYPVSSSLDPSRPESSVKPDPSGAVSGSGSDSDSDSSDSLSSDSDSSVPDSEESDENEDGPPESVTSKVAVSSMFEGDGTDGVKEDEDGARTAGHKPITHPSRIAAAQLGDDEQVESHDSVSEDHNKRFQVVCKYWRAGRCGLGSKCTYLHSLPPGSTTPRPVPPKRQRPVPRAAPHNPFARPSDPFDQLAERDFKHVVSDVLQVVVFLSRNDWLRGVEMRAGQMDEESGIEVLQESTTANEQVEVADIHDDESVHVGMEGAVTTFEERDGDHLEL